jgi:hypothetical protein
MNNKPKIKVRKKSAIAEKQEVVEVTEPAVQDTKELKSKVTGWVNEFHERLRKETETARKKFES